MACFGQTKLISHRSHSGTDADFRTAVEGNLFDIGNSNFGLRTEHIDKIDTVILKSNNKIIVLRKEYNIIRSGGKRFYNVVYSSDTLTKASNADFFLANSIDSLKTKISEMYIRNKYKLVKVDSAVFIGFDKKFRQKKGPLKKQV